jgi:acetoacetyl-CoA reductase
MQTDLKEKTALVIGGTTEVGTAICRQLARSGARVASDYQDESLADACRALLRQNNIDIHLFPADLTDYDSCNNLVTTIENELGPLDIIINALDFDEPVRYADMDKGQWDAALSLHLDSAFNICKQAVDGMSSRGFGRIVNVASVISRKGEPGHSHYGAAKAGMHGFTMALAQEMARNGVTVNTVSPGVIDGRSFKTMPEVERQNLLAGIPAARPGHADEIAYLVDFLCSDQAGYITGADIAVNGGQYMH